LNSGTTCVNECKNRECYYQNSNCENSSYCDLGCTLAMLNNGTCDDKCYNDYCEDDRGACADDSLFCDNIPDADGDKNLCLL